MITPVEIRQHTFNKALRGYDMEDVRAFLNSLSGEWEAMQEDNKRLKAENEKLNESVKKYQEVEALLQKTLLNAQENTNATMERANSEANTILSEAKDKAQTLLKDTEKKTREVLLKVLDDKANIEQEIIELTHKKNELIIQMREFLNVVVENMQNFEVSDVPVRSIPKPETITQPIVQQPVSEPEKNVVQEPVMAEAPVQVAEQPVEQPQPLARERRVIELPIELNQPIPEPAKTKVQNGSFFDRVLTQTNQSNHLIFYDL